MAEGEPAPQARASPPERSSAPPEPGDTRIEFIDVDHVGSMPIEMVRVPIRRSSHGNVHLTADPFWSRR